ncbi:nuclear transport factor 2 family protein [Amnibacterium flavum]|uniref:Nuclear transport factor 2 family protein n=1 Tax=Amnibacterium flavum TaxID=2173173 RepID=A0A2V1HSX1_9MICO|nr:nuclear transport factor 2 family protein [Amnibacterium flavum]PVZ94762.1 nuclear transport factor 2 family protein [Amnibacterium flavum]
MAEIADLLHKNLSEVFGQRDPGIRASVIADIFVVDAAFADEEGEAVGRDAISRKAQEIIDQAPADFVLAPIGPARVVKDLGALAWGFGPEAAEPVVTGVDTILVKDGRITALYTYLTKS